MALVVLGLCTGLREEVLLRVSPTRIQGNGSISYEERRLNVSRVTLCIYCHNQISEYYSLLVLFSNM